MEISEEKALEIRACLLATCKILKRAMYGVKFDGVFQNELARPLVQAGKLMFELDNLINNEKTK